MKVYIHKGVKCNRVQRALNIARHAKEERNQHGKAESSIQQGRYSYAERDDGRSILDFLRCSYIIRVPSGSWYDGNVGLPI